MDGQIDGNIKKERARRLIEIDKNLEKTYYERFLNTTLGVLIEEVKDGKSIGHTENFLKVEIDEELQTNKIYDVKIVKIFSDKVIGITLK